MSTRHCLSLNYVGKQNWLDTRVGWMLEKEKVMSEPSTKQWIWSKIQINKSSLDGNKVKTTA